MAAVFCTWGCTAAGYHKEKTPRLEIPKAQVNLGRVPEGEALSACFDLYNAGKGRLRILSIKSGCACIQAYYPREIPAEGRAEIRLKIDTRGFHGRRVFKTAIYSNDPDRPSVMLWIRAKIDPLVTLTPNRIFLTGGAGSNPLNAVVIIETRGKMPLKVNLEPHDLEARITATLAPVIKGRKYRLTVENRMKTPGAYRGRVMLQTNYPGRERIVVPVFVHLPPPVAVYPSRLVLKKSEKCPICHIEQLFTGTLTIRAHDDKPLRILSLGSFPAGFKWRIKPLVPERAYRIVVRYAARSYLPFELQITTNRLPGNGNTIPVPVALEQP